MNQDDQNNQDEEVKKDDDINEGDDLQKELEQLKKQNQEYLSGWQRALADYSNFQKDTEKRQREIFEFANASMISDIIPIYNNLKLAIKHVSSDQKESDFVKGIEQIKKQFLELFKRFNISEIETVGKQFDSNIHEAVEYIECKGHKEGEIFEEVSAGYMMGDKVLEPAKVKVAK